MLGGGLPVGDLLALVAPPESQSELLLRQLAATRETLYLDTSGGPGSEVDRRFPDDAAVEVTAVSPSELLSSEETVAGRIRPASFVLVDAADSPGRPAAPSSTGTC